MAFQTWEYVDLKCFEAQILVFEKGIVWVYLEVKMIMKLQGWPLLHDSWTFQQRHRHVSSKVKTSWGLSNKVAILKLRREDLSRNQSCWCWARAYSLQSLKKNELPLFRSPSLCYFAMAECISQFCVAVKYVSSFLGMPSVGGSRSKVW